MFIRSRYEYYKKRWVPWPLDINFFEVAQAPVDWKYQVFVTSRLEYKNFRRYALIYGLAFSKCAIKLSYIKNEGDGESELYYLLRILGAKVSPIWTGNKRWLSEKGWLHSDLKDLKWMSLISMILWDTDFVNIDF